MNSSHRANLMVQMATSVFKNNENPSTNSNAENQHLNSLDVQSMNSTSRFESFNIHEPGCSDATQVANNLSVYVPGVVTDNSHGNNISPFNEGSSEIDKYYFQPYPRSVSAIRVETGNLPENDSDNVYTVIHNSADLTKIYD